VAREKDGRLRKIPIPLHYAGIFVAAAVVGAFTITGLAGSYSRMLLKTASFNQVRSQQEALRKDYNQLQLVAHQKDLQAASLGSLASEVSALYGLRQSRLAKSATAPVAPDTADGAPSFTEQAYAQSLDQLASLRTNALTGSFRSFELPHWSRIGSASPAHPRSGRSSVPSPAPSANARTPSTVKAPSTPAWTSPPASATLCEPPPPEP
jgi:hypothetical protein